MSRMFDSDISCTYRLVEDVEFRIENPMELEKKRLESWHKSHGSVVTPSLYATFQHISSDADINQNHVNAHGYVQHYCSLSMVLSLY
jgi:hypothetical protein